MGLPRPAPDAASGCGCEVIVVSVLLALAALITSVAALPKQPRTASDDTLLRSATL